MFENKISFFNDLRSTFLNLNEVEKSEQQNKRIISKNVFENKVKELFQRSWMVLHGLLWPCRIFCGFLWSFMAFIIFGLLCPPLVFYSILCLLWSFMVFHFIWWLLWSFMTFYGLLWLFVVFCNLLWS